MVNSLNEKLKGWRGILVIVGTFLLMLFEHIAGLLGPTLLGGQVITMPMLIGAVIMAVPSVVKLLRTDAFGNYLKK